jgi:tetratricopeptide (TPR) repeat protein/CHAT domain-containing protein
VAAATDRFATLRSPDAAARTTLRQWAQAAQAKGDSLHRTDPAQARPLLRRALAAYRQTGDSARVAATLRSLGQAHEHASQYDAALARYQSALRASRVAGNRPLTAELLHDVGDVYKAKGDYETALSHYRSALSIKRELDNQNSVARTLNNAGLVHEYRGDYDKALDHYRESLSIKRELGDRKGIANTLNNVGIVQAIRGRYRPALKRWEASLSLKRELGDQEGVARTLNNLGNLYKNQGRYSEALTHFREALNILQALDQREEIATALNNIGTVQKRQGRYAKALSQYRASLAIKRELGDQRGVARTLANIGTIHQKQGHYRDALLHHQTSLSIKRELGDRRGIAVSLKDVGDVYARQGRLGEALRQYRRALQVNEEIGRRRGSARNLSGIGLVHLDQGRSQAAIDTLEQAIRISEELRVSTTSPDARRSLLATQVDAYRALTTAHLRADRPDAALRSLERARARLLADRLAGAARGDTAVAVPSAAQLRRALGPDEAALLYANTGPKRPLTALLATRDTVYARELPDSTVRGEVGRTYPNRLRRLRQSEGPLAAALEGTQTEPQSGPPSLAATIRLYRSLLTREAASDSVQHGLAHRLHDLLVRPIEERLLPYETITVVPSGALGYLPFETLVGPTGQYLIKDAHVRYAQSLTVLRHLQRRGDAQGERPLLAIGGAEYGGSPPATDGPLLAAMRGDSAMGTGKQATALFRSAERRMERGQSPRPAYAQLGYDQWPPLYGTTLEVRKLKQAVGPGTTLLTGAAASEEQVRALSASGELARYRHLHFATHGVAVPEAPQLSAMVLSQVGASDSRAARDGYLTMREIADLNLKADVAVLSACRTGLGRIVAGEGVVSLSHAFLRAGANATLVSQWRVLDWSTQQFMTATYRRAQADTTSFAEAVTQVKREFITGRFGERNTDPLRWAPFVYYGRE